MKLVLATLDKIDRRVRNFLKLTYHYLVYKKLQNIVGWVFLGLLVLFVVSVSAKLGFIPIMVLGVLSAAILLVLLSFFFERLPYYCALLVPFLLFPLERYLGRDMPLGVINQALVFLLIVVMLIKKLTTAERSFKFLRNPVTFMYSLFFIYLLLQAFNPHMESHDGWLIVIRFTLASLLTYVGALYLFKDLSFLDQFFRLLIILFTVAAIYAIKQEHLGFADFELRWIHADEFRFDRIFVEGKYRKFSLLSDPTAFGMLMSAMAAVTFIISLNEKKWIKYTYWLCAALMLLAMSYSGTRTAYAMVPAAVSIYGLMRITNTKTLAFVVFSVLTFIVIIFGPFYGGKTVSRIRSTFDTEDASLNVRNVNRQMIQPYIYDHPIGGGLMTTRPAGMKYNPNHYLATFPPDNGYLRIALEQGYIGLILFMTLLFTGLRVGVRNYYRARNPKIRNYLIAFITLAFSVTIALYAQSVTSQMPMYMIFWPVMGFMSRIMDFDYEESSQVDA